jgi:hypothetical protein
MRVPLATESSREPESLRSIDESVSKDLYVDRSAVFKDVSRLKSPTAQVVRFYDEQKARVPLG